MPILKLFAVLGNEMIFNSTLPFEQKMIPFDSEYANGETDPMKQWTIVMPFTEPEKDYFDQIASSYWVDFESLDRTINDNNVEDTSVR